MSNETPEPEGRDPELVETETPELDRTVVALSVPDPDGTVVTPSALDTDAEMEEIRAALGADYEIIEELGRGGMAAVYRARERALDREVAIKVLPLARTFDSELVERFQREARLSASLEHPYVLPIHRVGQVGRVNFFVMKYVRGASLADLLDERGRIGPTEVKRMLIEVGEALDHAHRAGVVHRDVKPDNIMRDEAGRFVVMDFGIAKSLGEQGLTLDGGSIGTPRYMSPEQARGGELDARSDLYSLGVVAYHCLVGEPPFEAGDALAILYSHLHDPVPEPHLDSDEARRIYGVVRRLLKKDPDERVRDGAELEAALRETPSAEGAPETLAAAVATVRFATGGRVAAGGRPVERVTSWLRARPSRVWVVAGPVALLLYLVFGPLGGDGASERCRAALPDASDADRAVLLDPIGVVAAGSEVEVAYVFCGLPGEEPFSATLAVRSADGGGLVGGVRRLFGGGDDPLRVTWDGEGDGFATVGRRTIGLGALDPGAYRLVLEVEDGRGREAAAEHDFTVVQE